MPIKKFLILAAGVLVACSPQSSTPGNTSLDSVLMAETQGCLAGPTEQFGRYVGDWDIQDWQLSREDGKTWNEGPGARWNFACVGNGIAVQDFWMPNDGGTGTNLRIYNPETESWDIVWTASGLPGTTQINATEQPGGEILMTYVSPEQSPPRRITFYPPTETGWDWALEMSMDGGENWTKVYKIKATRRAPENQG